jgi:hypothetical protein
MGYRLDVRGSIPGRDKGFYSTPQRSDRVWGPPSLLHNGYRELREVKRPRREANHTPPSSAEVNNGRVIPLLYTCLHGVLN